MKKLFTNDQFFLSAVICSVLGNLVCMITAYLLFGGDYVFSQLPLLIETLCIIFLYSSYKKHSKNVMKGLMGAVLMGQLLSAISILSVLILPVESIIVGVYLVLSVLFFISHFIINSDHHSKPGFITLNQILCLICAIDIIVWAVLWILEDQSLLSVICSVATMVFCIATAASIVCVESRLDAYRLDREAAGWTEEAGYPEGYIHEYEKK